MIPISADQVLKVPVADVEGLNLHLRYPVGEYYDRFMAWQGGNSSDTERLAPYKEPATKNVKAKNHGVPEKKLKLAIAKEMARLAAADGNGRSSGSDNYRELVDIFVCGWDAPKNWPAVPEDGHPSKFFRPGDLMQIVEVIMDNVDELTGMGLDEAKN